jgi:hydroxymethylpyrimidine/phosphomethylpyrimidine kinase
MPRAKLPIALTIAGSDSGGGAGIQADLKTFAHFRVHGTSAITCLTAQNPAGVSGVHASPPKFVRAQIDSVFAELPPTSVKTGMLFSTEIIRAVVEALRQWKPQWIVVDPVMVATSGAPLLKPAALRVLRTELIPLASLITPNLDEAALLVGRPLASLEDVQAAARQLHDLFGCTVLLKGGHLKSLRAATDILFDGETELALSSPFTRGVSTHGTGCTYSAAIAAALALGMDLGDAVETAKCFISEAIRTSQRIGRHTVLNTISPAGESADTH